MSGGLLNGIVHFSLRFRGVVIALACALVGCGLFVLSQASPDVFPEFAPPQVTMQTEAPGLSPEQVENAINGVADIGALRSSSIQGCPSSSSHSVRGAIFSARGNRSRSGLPPWAAGCRKA